ncbi:hypothetical protein MBLNU459_g5638t1 [Dothideomycetes sp. NU459]
MSANELSHNEIWDDSALVQSWNEALDEYKKYHSIAAKGEYVEDVLRAVEQSEASTAIQQEVSGIDENGGLSEWTPKIDDRNEARSVNASLSSSSEPVKSSAVGTQPSMASKNLATMPQALMNTVHDEGLKNLMMAWYYAGYYTGLHEGQQTASAAQHDSSAGSKEG